MHDMMDDRAQEYAESFPYEIAQPVARAAEEPGKSVLQKIADAVSDLWDRMFGCAHAKTSFPMSPVDSSDRDFAAHVVCMGCGAQFEYDFRTMRRGRRIPQPSRFKSWEGTRYGKR